MFNNNTRYHVINGTGTILFLSEYIYTLKLSLPYLLQMLLCKIYNFFIFIIYLLFYYYLLIKPNLILFVFSTLILHCISVTLITHLLFTAIFEYGIIILLITSCICFWDIFLFEKPNKLVLAPCHIPELWNNLILHKRLAVHCVNYDGQQKIFSFILHSFTDAIDFRLSENCGGSVQAKFSENWEDVCHLKNSDADRLCKHLKCGEFVSQETILSHQSLRNLKLNCTDNHNNLKHCISKGSCQNEKKRKIYCKSKCWIYGFKYKNFDKDELVCIVIIYM